MANAEFSGVLCSYAFAMILCVLILNLCGLPFMFFQRRVLGRFCCRLSLCLYVLHEGAFVYICCHWFYVRVWFPTCQVRVVRFYVSCLLLLLLLLLLSLSSSSSCSTATRDPQCSLPDLNREYPRPVFPAGPQPRPSTPSVPCRTSTTTIPAQCSLPDLNHDHPRPVFPAGPQPRVSTPSVPCRTSCRKIWDKECAEES